MAEICSSVLLLLACRDRACQIRFVSVIFYASLCYLSVV